MIRRHPLIGSAGSKYGLVYTDNNAVFLERQTANGAITDSKKLKIKIKELKGKSFVWNQLAQSVYPHIRLMPGYTTSMDEGYPLWTWEMATSISRIYIGVNPALDQMIVGHKYMFRLKIKKLRGITPATGGYFSISLLGKSLFLCTYSDFIEGAYFSIISEIGTTSNNVTIYQQNYETDGSIEAGGQMSIGINLIDLTLLGIDNLTTVEEVEAWLANNIGDFPYYAFNSGTILNSKFNIFESVEFNQWDEEWELGGINTATGENQVNNDRIRSKNYCHCFPNTAYNKTATSLRNIVLCFYDAAKNYIGWHSTVQASVTTPNGACYFKLIFFGATTYNNDICINLSNPIHNGQYKPYKHHIINLNLTTITGKVNGEGESVIICPDGLKSAGTAYDEGVIENGYLTKIIKRIGVVDMGTLDWAKKDETGIFISRVTVRKYDIGNYNLLSAKYPTYTNSHSTSANISTLASDKDKELFVNSGTGSFYAKDSAYAESTSVEFKTAMSNVILNFELAEPITYILDNPIYVGTYGHSYGVERILPQNTEEPYTTPANMVIDYLAKG